MDARTFAPELIATINATAVFQERGGYTGRKLADFLLRREVKEYREQLAHAGSHGVVDHATLQHIEQLKAVIRHLCFRLERVAQPAGTDGRTDAERLADAKFLPYPLVVEDRRAA